jgi:hypothetical protein
LGRFFNFEQKQFMNRPIAGDYPVFYETYVKLVPEEDLASTLTASVQDLQRFLADVPYEKADFAYGSGKWTVKQVLQHAIDAERVFAYRALCFARNEQQSLPGFNENEYAANAEINHRSLKDLKDEFLAVRQTTLQMFHSFTEEMLGRKGVANNNSITVRSLGYVIVGHWRHHERILQERYGV